MRSAIEGPPCGLVLGGCLFLTTTLRKLRRRTPPSPLRDIDSHVQLVSDFSPMSSGVQACERRAHPVFRAPRRPPAGSRCTVGLRALLHATSPRLNAPSAVTEATAGARATRGASVNRARSGG